MHRIIALLLLFSTPAVAADPIKELEARLQKVIEDAAPSVVGVVVAHSKYPPPSKPADKQPGKLGKYEPALPQSGGRIPIQANPVDPLDLREPANAADHTFGAGIVLDATKRYILTPYHLIDGATKIFVRGSSGKGSYADIRAADARSDLAVLELIDPVPGLIEAKLATVHLVESPTGAKVNLKRGAFVVSVGHPMAVGLADGAPSGSWGILSNIRRRSAQAPNAAREEIRTKPLHAFGNLLQTDARVAMGTTGSALINLDGEVIGIATTVAAVSGSESSGGYALPLDVNYRRVIQQLAAGKEVEYGFLGVLPGVASAQGVEVQAVTQGCPAADADLRPGDVIQSIDGNPLRTTDDLHLYVSAALASSKVTVVFTRGRENLKTELTLAKNHNPMAFIASVPPVTYSGLQVDYASIRYAQQAINRGFQGTLYPTTGVAVRELAAGSTAEKKFVDLGDFTRWLITKVDGKVVSTPAAFQAATAGKASVTLTLVDITTSNRSTTIVLP